LANFILYLDITSPEITEEYEGGIEVQDEIGQASRDTSSLKDITSSEITEEYEGGIKVQDESLDWSYLVMTMYHVILGRFDRLPQFHLHVLH
jgi:hypothetical protein